MPQEQQQISDLGGKISELEGKLASVSGELAELNQIMLPFMTRYRQMILPYYDQLVAAQRDIADLMVEQGDRSASEPGDAKSPLDQFFEGPSVQEQFDKAWQVKQQAKPTGPLNLNVATPQLKDMYRKVAALMHPILADTQQEKERRRQLFYKIDEAYVQRNEMTLQAMVDSFDERSYVPAIASSGDPVTNLRDRVVGLETAVGVLEGQYYDLRYGPMAKLKAFAEQAWAEQKRDLLTELSQEIQAQLRGAQAQLEMLKAH
jgi:hypothetical protein